MRGILEAGVLLEVCVFIERATEVEYRDGMFRVTIYVGENPLRLCVPPNIFLAGLWSASTAAQEFQDSCNGPKVVALHPHPVAERATA